MALQQAGNTSTQEGDNGHLLYNQLLAMGFATEISVQASQRYNDIDAAIEWINQQSNKKALSIQQSDDQLQPHLS